MHRYSPKQLLDFAQNILVKAGLEQIKAKVVAEALVEADLLGHSTHGVKLLRQYVATLQDGSQTRAGEGQVVKDTGSTILIDGNYLPGTYLVTKAIEKGLSRMAEHPVISIAIRKSHHTGCLASFLTKATEKGYMITIYNSDPSHKGSAPYGGTKALLNPNPIAVGIPTKGDPILIDISTSTTSVGRTVQMMNKGETAPGPWYLDADGRPSNDPHTFFADPPGSITPLGGPDAGYKGFALMLMVEAMTNAMCGWGRKDEPGRWGCNVFIQLINPNAFGGCEHFIEESSFVSAACRQNPPIDPGTPVRMPGESGLAKRRMQLEEGIELDPNLLAELEKLAVEMEMEPLAQFAS